MWERRVGLHTPNCSLAPGPANIRVGGAAKRPPETGGPSAEGFLPEEGNDAHGPVGKGERVGERTAHLPPEVNIESSEKYPPCEHCHGKWTRMPPSGKTLNQGVQTSLEESRVRAGPAQEAMRSLGVKGPCLPHWGKARWLQRGWPTTQERRGTKD